MHAPQTLIAALAAGVLCACSGGAAPPVQSSGPSGATPGRSDSAYGRVQATIVLPPSVKRAARAHAVRQYVSPSTQGLIIQVAQVTGGGSPVTYSVTGYDLSANSKSATCTPVASGTACTFYFDAPATTATSTDVFSLYAYDSPQDTTELAAGGIPAGSLLSEDTSDAVPSARNVGINANQLNSLSFTLLPVVFQPVANIGGATGQLVLSMPGRGGSTNAVAIDGYDAGNGSTGNEISASLRGDDDTYVNPIAITAGSSSGSATDINVSPATLTSALSDSVTASWTAATAAVNQPPAPAAAPYFATLTATSSLTAGGYDDTETFSPHTATVTIAPLFSAVTPISTTGPATTFHVYAVQYAIPTGRSAASYSVAPDTTVTNNNCSGFAASAPTTTGLSGSQRASWTITLPTNGAAGQSCTYAISDGISSTDAVALQPTSAVQYYELFNTTSIGDAGCAPSESSLDQLPSLGYVTVTPQANGNAVLTAQLVGAAANTTYTVYQQCVATLGPMTTDANGNASFTYTFPNAAGTQLDVSIANSGSGIETGVITL